MPPKDYPAFITCFDRLSRQYMWCYTASDYEGEDISLYDLMKISEAVMACMMRKENEEKSYTMVSGDFSGIQKYIFSISSANHKGVAKRLRARSFYVDSISRIFSQYVVDSFGVGRANILLQTGGKFYCLVPTMNDMDKKMMAIRNEFDRHLYETFHGSVSVNLAWLLCDEDLFADYSNKVVELNDVLGEQKKHPFRDVLKNESGWESDAFVLCQDLKGKHLCKNCGTELVDSGTESCRMCDEQINIGGRIPRTRYLVYYRKDGMPLKENVHHIFKDYYIDLADKVTAESAKDAFLIEALNEAPVDDTVKMMPFVRKYMANHAPTEDYAIKSFEEIAAESKGMNKLAVLKADVDILGFLFAQGLRTKERHFGTISRVNTMSRMLEAFFSGYIEDMMEKKPEYQNVYSVYSGGDDLFLIGPWDVMLEMAVDIQKDFRRFVADNECVTMSAAVSVFDSKSHIAFMAESTEEQLKQAKNEPLTAVYPQGTGRNAACVMDSLISWKDLENQLNISNQIAKLLVRKSLDAGILRRLAKYSRMYQDYLMTGNTWNLMFEPMFYYDRKRNYPKEWKTFNDEREWFYKKHIKSMENAANSAEIKKNLYFAEFAVKIALNKTRKERN